MVDAWCGSTHGRTAADRLSRRRTAAGLCALVVSVVPILPAAAAPGPGGFEGPDEVSTAGTRGEVVDLDDRVVDLVPRVEDLVEEGPATTITLGSDILFAFDSAEVGPEATESIAGVVDRIRDEAPLRVELAGHTDSVASDAYNLDLSQRRADAVAALLREGLGGDAPEITAEGFGESTPVADDDNGRDAAAAARNRRVVITLVPG